MKYLSIEPEVIVGLGEESKIDFLTNPPKVDRLQINLEDWLGDDLVECYPVFLITDILKIDLQKNGFSGFEIKDLQLTFDEAFEDNFSLDKKPNFFWLNIVGKKNIDDFYIDESNVLNVTEKLFEFLQKYNMQYCTKYEGNEEIDNIFAEFEKRKKSKDN